MTAKTSFRGSFTALVTPFSNGALDERAFRGLVDWQIAEGTSGLVPVGTTGESPTLSDEEQIAVIKRVAAVAAGRVPVLAGTGVFSTKKTIAASRAALANHTQWTVVARYGLPLLLLAALLVALSTRTFRSYQKSV